MAFVQQNSTNWTTDATRSVTLGSNVAVGELVVAWINLNANTTVTWSNSGTATLSAWQEVGALNIWNAGDGYGQEVAYARVTGAGTLTVTATVGSAASAVAAATFDEMPDPLVLQTQVYTRDTTSPPASTNMTPTAQPAWVIGLGACWGSYDPPGNDAANGWSDAGTVFNDAGFLWARVSYRRITSTSALPIQFTTNGGTQPWHVSGLIFTEAGGGGGPTTPEFRLSLLGVGR